MKIQLTILTILVLQGCTNNSQPETPSSTSEQSHSSVPSNRVSIPPAVRLNLGITFATVERRQLQDTLRAPGRFEYLPSAKREYRTMLAGKIDLLVRQFDKVEKDQPLFRIDSPAWREIQQTITNQFSTVHQLNAKMEMFNPLFLAHEQHEYSVKANVEMWEERIAQLEAIREAGGGSLREWGAKSTLDISLESAASMMNIQIPEDNPNWWKESKHIEVTATHAGIVEKLDVTNGSWADAQANIMTIVQPDQLRFHASGLQSDLGVLQNGLQVNIVPPTPTSGGNAVDLQNTMHGTLQLGLTGDANDRTIDLYVTPDKLSSWARPGVTAQLEIITDSTGVAQLAIPLVAVQQDGLTPIIFRRDPNNPNEAIRMEADLGLNDGRWVAVLSGLTDGDEVVLDGGFQLMLATSGSIQGGGHFHSDGTFHEGDH